MTDKPTHAKLYSIGETAKTAGVARDQAVDTAQAYGVEPLLVSVKELAKLLKHIQNILKA